MSSSLEAVLIEGVARGLLSVHEIQSRAFGRTG